MTLLYDVSHSRCYVSPHCTLPQEGPSIQLANTLALAVPRVLVVLRVTSRRDACVNTGTKPQMMFGQGPHAHYLPSAGQHDAHHLLSRALIMCQWRVTVVGGSIGDVRLGRDRIVMYNMIKYDHLPRKIPNSVTTMPAHGKCPASGLYTGLQWPLAASLLYRGDSDVGCTTDE